MKKLSRMSFVGPACAVLCLVFSGCSKTSDSAKSDSSGNGGDGKTKKTTSAKTNVAAKSHRSPIFVADDGVKQTGGTKKSGNATPRFASAREALKTLQVVVGQWRGETSRPKAGFKGLEEPAWQWDFSDKDRAALSFVSKTSPFLRKGRLTYLTDTHEFELTADVDRSGTQKTFRGNFTEPVRDEAMEGHKKLQRTFKLSLTQVKPEPKNVEPLYRVEFQQVHNNRYWLIVHRKAGATVRKSDTVGNQREGTLFAASPDDYGEKTCVVTQGLGTMTVSYEGKTYYVCCSGCRKTFEDEPKKWIAAFEDWKRKKRNK